MVRADTSWVVTGVCDVFSRWPLSVFKEPRYAVRVFGLQVDAESAISVVQQVCFPHPAAVGLLFIVFLLFVVPKFGFFFFCFKRRPYMRGNVFKRI